jgi:glutathione S-transferase
MNVYNGVFGWAKLDAATYNSAINDLKKNIRVMNTALEGKKFLLGDDLSVADVIIANYLMYGFQTVLDQGFMKSIKNVNDWAAKVFALPEYIHIFGKIQMCQKPLKPALAEAPKKEEKKKAVAAAPKVEKKKEEKPKANIDLLPPTDFNIYDFKTFFINHPDKKGKGTDEMYK